MPQLRAGIIGATGFVGQRFLSLLDQHPWFEVKKLAASKRSAGKSYREAIADKWRIDVPRPERFDSWIVQDSANVKEFAKDLDLVFCAVDMGKEDLIALEESYAREEVVVISNNSANRWTPDVPMIIPEVNPEHTALIEAQRQRLGTKRGFIAAKPNCSIQSYVPALDALKDFRPSRVIVSTYQAISGAGKTFKTWPEMDRNLIPYIGGEEAKSEDEPLRIWGDFAGDHIELAKEPLISANCYRVAVQEGHTVAVNVEFEEKVTKEQILEAWKNYEGKSIARDLPSAPQELLHYFEEDDRPQPKLDAMYENGMGFMVSRLREDKVFDYRFCGLSHNTIRGAAGGAILMAELLTKQGYIQEA